MLDEIKSLIDIASEIYFQKFFSITTFSVGHFMNQDKALMSNTMPDRMYIKSIVKRKSRVLSPGSKIKHTNDMFSHADVKFNCSTVIHQFDNVTLKYSTNHLWTVPHLT